MSTDDGIHPLVKLLVNIKAQGTPDKDGKYWKCDYEGCPGYTSRAKKRLIWHPKYLFVHNKCVSLARRAARERGECFGFRLGL